jgi:predicted Zn-dependent protease
MNSRATLGAVTSSSSSKLAHSSYRLMFGSYDMNDENFEESPSQEMVFPRNIAEPIECDYMGIRRALWNNADHSYKSASRNYIAKKAYYAKNPDLKPGYPDYFKQEPVVLEKPEITDVPTLLQADSLVRALSYLFRKFENISSSAVSYNLINCNMYLVNSEGTKLRIPACYASVEVFATITNDGGEKFSESLSFVSMEPNEFVSKSSLGERVNAFAEYLEKVSKAPKLEDDYNGPVLYSGRTAVPKVMGALFMGKDALIATREDVQNTPSYRKPEPKNNNNVESKIGKRFMPAAFSVIMKPRLESYKGIKLFGKTDVDYEGAIPPDEIILVENGILKNLLRSRITTSKSVTASNGHRRLSITSQGIYSDISPSVVFYTSSEGKPNETLKQSLLAEAREKGLDYAILVKPVDDIAGNAAEAFYKVAVADGKETLIRPLNITNEGGKMINHISGCSDSEMVVNIMGENNYNPYGENGEYGTGTINGSPCSVILPDAFLFIGMEAQTVNASVDKLLLPPAGE